MTSSVEDQLAVAAVMHRYARTVDTHDFAGLRTCFTDDCTLSGYPPPAPEVVRGGDAIIEYISTQLQKYGRTQHMLGQIEVTVDGDEARAESYVQAFHLLANDPSTMVNLWGSYHDHFVRIDGKWVIDEHRIDIVHIERRPTPGRG
jgi:ketosteroid isomerase-like protein